MKAEESKKGEWIFCVCCGEANFIEIPIVEEVYDCWNCGVKLDVDSNIEG